MRVFVLTTGRTGSTTFARACAHAENFTAGHETAAHRIESRLDYPDHHIEVDNRLAFFLGLLHERYPSARYVHLRRDPDLVASSYSARAVDSWPIHARLRDAVRRIPGRYGWSLTSAFSHGILIRDRRLTPPELERSVRLLIDATNANITEFLRDKPSMEIRIDTASAQFPAFWQWIGARGDYDAALGEFSVRHNASRSR